MKKLVSGILAMLLPLSVFAQAPAQAPAAPAAPRKNTISTYRIFAKDGHAEALKAAIAAHAQKFHSGNWKWRVNEVLSGPDGGAYQIVEGPNSWTDIDDRGDLGAEHGKDYDMNITPHVDKSTPDTYLTYQASASTTAAANWSNKSVITHYYTKPGRGPALYAMLKAQKAVHEKLGNNVVIWMASSSGEPQYVVVRRLKNGLKDFDAGGATWREAYEAVYGNGAADRALEEIARNVDRIVGEMIEFKPAMSSK
jgi:hypothetical protein